MSMRAALLLAPILAACRPAHDPESIRRALAKTPIDVAALEEAFRVEPNALRIHAPELPAISLSPPDGPWVLENVSARPVWVRTAWLTVKVEHDPFLPPSPLQGGRAFGRYGHRNPNLRPDFKPEEWVLLSPGERTALALHSTAREPGELRFSAKVADAGAALIEAARDFNKSKRNGPAADLATHAARTLLLPPADGPGMPWHGDHPIEPVVKGRRVELTLPTTAKEAGPLELDVFAAGGERVTRATMKAESFDSARGTAVYALPPDLRGTRALFLARDVATYILGPNATHACDASDDAASRWIPLGE